MFLAFSNHQEAFLPFPQAWNLSRDKRRQEKWYTGLAKVDKEIIGWNSISVCVWLIKTRGEYLPGDQHFLHHQMLLTWPGTARETLQQRQDIAQPAGKAVRVADSQNCRCLAKVNIRVDRKHIHIRLQSNVSQVILMLLYPEAWRSWYWRMTKLRRLCFLASLSVGTDYYTAQWSALGISLEGKMNFTPDQKIVC